MSEYKLTDVDDKVMFVREAGAVSRFHTSPYMAKEQDVAQHTFNMLAMFMVLFPDTCRECSCRIMQAIIQHDIEERITGDIPKPSKLSFIDRTKLHKFEEKFLVDMFQIDAMSELSEENQYIVKALDILDLFLWCHEEMKRGNQTHHLFTVLETVIDYNRRNPDKIHPRIGAIIAQGWDFSWSIPELEHTYNMKEDR